MTTKILLVDDEDGILDTLACMFEEISMNVATAATPAEALRLVSEEQFRMAFVDHNLVLQRTFIKHMISISFFYGTDRQCSFSLCNT